MGGRIGAIGVSGATEQQDEEIAGCALEVPGNRVETFGVREE